MHERTLLLHKIMTEHGLSCRDVADILDRSEQTVFIWRCKSNAKIIPAHQIELLQLKLEAAKS